MKGQYTLTIPLGAYTLTASKEGYTTQTVENVKVLEGQTTIVNIQLGGDNMRTYTEPIVVRDGSLITINVPIEEPAVSIKFLDVDAPMVNKDVELLAEDNTTLQTKITDAEGIATLVNVLHGNYKVRITY